jgi:tetratricopeptide (TPR) repeat protein
MMVEHQRGTASPESREPGVDRRRARERRVRSTWILGLAVACAHLPPETLEQRAETLRRHGDAAGAYEAYATLLCERPAAATARRFVETWAELGAAGDPQARLADCVFPSWIGNLVTGLVAGTGGDEVTAERALAEAAAVAPPAEQGDLAYRRGLLALSRKDFASARGLLEKAAGLAPARTDVRVGLAHSLAELGEGEEAAALLASILELTPTREELERARKVLAALVRRSEAPLPEGVEATLSGILAELERGAPSPESLAHAMALADELPHPRALKVAGLVALHRGLTAEARRRLEAAADLNPLDPEPWRILGTALHATDQPRDALPPLREAMRRDPFDVEVVGLVAAAAAANGDADTAREAYRRLTVLDPGNAESFLWLARMESKLGHLHPARQYAGQGLALSPRHVPLLLELATLEAQLVLTAGNAVERAAAKQRAEAAVSRLLEVAPDHPAAATILASIEGAP